MRLLNTGCVQCADLTIKGLSVAGHSGVTNKHVLRLSDPRYMHRKYATV